MSISSYVNSPVATYAVRNLRETAAGNKIAVVIPILAVDAGASYCVIKDAAGADLVFNAPYNGVFNVRCKCGFKSNAAGGTTSFLQLVLKNSATNTVVIASGSMSYVQGSLGNPANPASITSTAYIEFMVPDVALTTDIPLKLFILVDDNNTAGIIPTDAVFNYMDYTPTVVFRSVL